MSIRKTIGFWVSVACLAAINAQAATAYYTLDNVFLQDGTQMTGTVSWTYPVDDFANHKSP